MDFPEGIKGLVDTVTWNFQKMLGNVPHALKKLGCSGMSKADNTRVNNLIKKSLGKTLSLLKLIEVISGIPQRSTIGICLFNILKNSLAQG